MSKPEQNGEFSWTVQYIDGEYWWFSEHGLPYGPYSNYDSASDDLDDYANSWELID